MLACEGTTPRCNPHLEDKPTVESQHVKSKQQRWMKKLDKKTIFYSTLQPPLQNGRFLKLWSLGNLAKHRLEPIFDNKNPRDKRSVYRDKSSKV